MASEVWVRPDGGTLNVNWDKALKDAAAGAKQRGEKPPSLQQFQQETRNQYLRNGYKLQGGGGTKPNAGGGGAAEGGGGGGGGGGAAATPSMAGLADAASMSSGGGDGGGAGTMGAGSLLGPSKFRQGIGTRILPQMSQSLAALKQVY